MFLYIFFRWLLCIPLMILLPTRVKGWRNILIKGGAIIVSNHLSYLDVFVMAFACPRPIHFLAKSELYRNFLLRVLLYSLGAIPIKRGSADLKAIRRCIEITKKGGLLCIYPEGTTIGKKAGPVSEIKQGASLIALKTNVDIIPVMLIKKPRLFVPNTMIIGKPFKPGNEMKLNGAALDEVSELMKNKMNELVGCG
ncbi:MAG TPA: lysophospholipid acyltransferase family protein [Clostridia bacterium]|nr:lysophospholipid acyltransferase family protein [Clostridia bacterium]